MRKLVYCLTLVFVAALATVTVSAQTTSGRLVGTVTSADGALVPGASIVVTDAKTAKETNLTSNSEGSFGIPNMDPGQYIVKVSSPGFKTTTTTITVQVSQEYSLSVQLAVGDVTEVVTVTSGTD